MNTEFLVASVKDGGSLYHGEALIVELGDEYKGRLCVFVGSMHFVFQQRMEAEAMDSHKASMGPWRYFDGHPAEIFFG